MPSYINIELDTTPPDLEIYAPNYTTKSNSNEIRIVANETLSSYQDIHLTDINNVRYDIIFDHQNNSFIGSVSFSDFPLGIVTLNVILKDEVLNQSSLYQKTINIIESNDLLKLDPLLSANEIQNEIEINELSIDIFEPKLNTELLE